MAFGAPHPRNYPGEAAPVQRPRLSAPRSPRPSPRPQARAFNCVGVTPSSAATLPCVAPGSNSRATTVPYIPAKIAAPSALSSLPSRSVSNLPPGPESWSNVTVSFPSFTPLPCGWRSFDIEAWPFPSPIPNLTPLSRFPRYRRLRRWPRLVGQPVGLIKVCSSRHSCRHVISSVASTGPRLPSPTRSSAEVRVTALQL